MANHVHFHIHFNEINTEAKDKLREMLSRIRKDNGYGYQWFADMFVSGDLTYEMTEKYEWTITNIGPKWCYIEDIEVDVGSIDTYINGYSAWVPPLDGLHKVLSILEQFDPNIIATIDYDDEGLNFVGAAVYKGSEQVDIYEDEYSDLIAGVIETTEGLSKESWNEEEGEWVDQEANDLWDENVYEYVSDSQYNFISETLDYLKENPN